ncbi:PucR family transcriptional regulator [Streptomyces nigra]|uniref:PucR family transcriptional regulator n=1 Tax=Streptomyces TaxID=1883 RepID=UPI0006E3B3C8|nr:MULTISPECIES: PucR family transcriptional regulator [unclassified Streptomyces]MBQ0998341.1 helix-turn-helix domain-containing protein [Streptomyces sp. RK62]RDS61411.1 PucR family transcriptional regulator [Streptomyces sp. M7]
MAVPRPAAGPAALTRSAWHDVPRFQVRRFAQLVLADAPGLAEEILEEIRREYPHLPVVLDESGEPMALIGIRRAIEVFIGHLETSEGRPTVPPGVFQDFGRGEGYNGRSLDSLQAIYRLGVRLAWRRFAEIGQRVDIPPPAMYELVDAGYEYLDGLVDQSVRGYAEAAARQAGERLRLQRRLMELLLAERHRGDPADALAERAARIGWALPAKVAVGVLLRPAREALAPAVGEGVLLDLEYERPRMVVPEPDAAGRHELLGRALSGWSGAIGPPVPLAEAAKSLRWAEAAVGLMERGLLPAGEVLHCTEHTEALVLLQPEELIDDLAVRCLAPLEHCGPSHGRRLAETLLAWLETRGGAPEVAARLGVHPQTVRYRLRQIRELWGAEIDDPDRRFELELVLRAQRLRGVLGETPR